MHMILGGVDVSNYVTDDGITRGTIDRVVKTRTTMLGKKYVSKVKKLAYGIEFEPMDETTLKSLVEALDSDTVSMSYKDPVVGNIFKQFLPEVDPVDLIMEDTNGVTYWSGLKITLEEQ